MDPEADVSDWSYIDGVDEKDEKTARTRGMTKKDLVDALAAQMKCTKVEAKHFVDAFTVIASTELQSKGVFNFPGLGRVLVDRTPRYVLKSAPQ